MIALRAALGLIVLAAALPVQARAQTQAHAWQPGPGASAADQHRYQADRHRDEIGRLRALADQREDVTRQNELEFRLNRLRLVAARQTEPALPPALRPLRSPQDERVARLSATERRRATTAAVAQIDAWLDRRPQ